MIASKAGTYYANPDCLEAIEAPAIRTRDDLVGAARNVGPGGYLYLTEREFEQIRSEVGLGYRWQGRRLHVF
jgi:hypothetical protein